MSTANVPATAKQTMELLSKTPVIDIPTLPEVRDKYIANYNACNGGSNGDFMYQRNLVYLQQILNSTDAYRKCNEFSVYVCLTTIAAYGYSVDPADRHIYLIPREGRLCISKQAGAHLLRLYKTKQIVHNSEATLIYEGDTFSKKNGLIDHEECYKSDKIIGGYVKFTLDEKGTQRHISYKMADIEAWRAKSPQATGPNWRFGDTGQPAPGFLRTKILSHACSEQCWLPGNNPLVDTIEANNVFVDGGEDVEYAEEITEDSAPEQQPEAKADTPPASKPSALSGFIKKTQEPDAVF